MGATSTFSTDPVKVPRVETRNRSIVTPIPPPGVAAIFRELDTYESRSMHGALPVVWDRASGFRVFDAWGNCWIDFTSTIFVANVGHANPRITAAVRGVLDGELLHSYIFATDIRARYLRRLVEFTPPQFEKAYLVSSGTEATECVVKLMRMYGAATGKRRGGVITFEGAMHGRTMGAQFIGGNPAAREWIGHEDPNVHRVPVAYPWEIEDGAGAARFESDLEALRARGVDPEQDIAGVLVESYIGWLADPIDYIQALRRWTEEHGVVLAFDEIQSGFGRTGRLFAYEHYGVEPDVICCGKGMGSGFPLAAVLGPVRIMDVPEIGSMSSTHSANPIVCAAGLATIEEIEERSLVAEAARKGEQLFERLHALSARHPTRVPHVLGHGLLAAILITDSNGAPDGEAATRICERAMQKGLLLVHTGRESIKMGPPLMISDDALAEGLDVLDEAVAEIVG